MAILVSPLFGLAQYSPWNGEMNVNGIHLGSIYTKAQVTDKWGESSKYESQISEFGLGEYYYYGSNHFEFSDNGIFITFYINTPDFVLWVTKNSGMKVGDDIAQKIRVFGLDHPLWALLIKVSKKGTLYMPIGDDPLRIGYSDGKITWMWHTTWL
jgi:hypothetical protein